MFKYSIVDLRSGRRAYMYCKSCGNYMGDSAYCSKCGAKAEGSDANFTINDDPNHSTSHHNVERKSKLAAGLLGIFLGGLGIHNFYLGFTNKAITQLLLGTIGWILIIPGCVSWIWGLIDGILILSGSVPTDANGVPLKD